VIGSSKHLADKKRAIEEALKELEEKIEDTEDLTKEDFKEALEANNPKKVFSRKTKKLALKELKKSKKKLKGELNTLNSIQINEDGYSRTLSAEEILALDSRSLSEILNKENEKYYSDAQKAEIDKARDVLNKRIENSSLDLTVPAHRFLALANIGSLFARCCALIRSYSSLLI
jgi:tRNA A37 N6-isopentenylltransferase MiaA